MYGAVTHKIHEHATILDRVNAACILQDELLALKKEHKQLETVPTTPIVLDGMDNLISKSFGALPERLAILVNGKLVFLGGKGPEEYSVLECRRALQDVVNTPQP
mmetsp:Transcript_12201/g.14738  ORF Transcript_12201/g.14738 Transcript_12201/m.14738 type:complete len:105 (+) Transcript_12201:494-808(+)